MTRKLPVAISEDEFTSLIKATKHPHHKLAFLLGFGAGMRISEVIKLEPRDIDLTERKIFIRQSKGGKDRIIPLPKGFKNEMVELLPFKCSGRAVQIAFNRACKRAGITKNKPSVKFHSLRHGFATHCIKQNMPIHFIRTMMGHSNISTTNVYLESNPKEALKSYEELF